MYINGLDPATPKGLCKIPKKRRGKLGVFIGVFLPMAAPAALESPLYAKKVVIHLRATGDAPILKQSKFKVAGSDKFVKIIEFLRGQLHRDTLFVYVNSAFSPNPDELVIDLYNNFGFDGKLVVNYACSMAWG